MPAAIQPPPVGTPMLDRDGRCNFVWEGYFRARDKQRVTSSRDTLANIPTDLKQEDEGYLFTATDYARTWRWTGTAWQRADSEMPTLFVGLFGAAPGAGWKLLNGASNPFTYTKDDATTGTVSVQDARGYYLKAVAAFTGSQVAAVAPGATGPTISTDATGITANSSAANLGGPSGTTVVQSGAGATVASSTHNHTDSGHTHGITDPSHTHTPGTVTVDAAGEPPHMGFLVYMKL